MARTYVNDVTGDPIVSKVSNSAAYQDGWDRIFGKGKKKKECGGDGCQGCEGCRSTEDTNPETPNEKAE